MDMTSSFVLRARGAGRVLVVDDEPSILSIVERVLHHANYRVITSRSGGNAWHLIKRGRPKIDLVLTDMVMPGPVDGLVLAGKIRGKWSNLPVLFMTGAVPDSDDYAAEMARKRLLLRKPFAPRELIELIDWHLKERGAEKPVRRERSPKD
jgi:two-component system, cell cycle sensor histidine kinase and response regulator CckA